MGRQGPRWQWLGREKEGGMNPVQGREMLRCFCCQASGFVVSPQLCSVFGSLFRPLLMPSTARCMFRCFVLALKPGLPHVHKSVSLIVGARSRVPSACRSINHVVPNLIRLLHCSLDQYLDMPHNSAVVMWGGCQERYKHAVPSMTKGVGTHPMAGEKLR